MPISRAVGAGGAQSRSHKRGLSRCRRYGATAASNTPSSYAGRAVRLPGWSHVNTTDDSRSSRRPTRLQKVDPATLKMALGDPKGAHRRPDRSCRGDCAPSNRRDQRQPNKGKGHGDGSGENFHRNVWHGHLRERATANATGHHRQVWCRSPEPERDVTKAPCPGRPILPARPSWRDRVGPGAERKTRSSSTARGASSASTSETQCARGDDSSLAELYI